VIGVEPVNTVVDRKFPNALYGEAKGGAHPWASWWNLSESRMREIRTSGSMSGDGKRGGLLAATAPILDSTATKNGVLTSCARLPPRP